MAAMLGAGCSSPTAPGDAVAVEPRVIPAGAQIVHPAPPSPPSTCGDPTASYPPPSPMPAPGNMPPGTFMAKIQARGRLVVGVDQNTYLWGYRDPITGLLSGFDIDMLRQVSQAIFGSNDLSKVEFRPIANADRMKELNTTTDPVDIVAFTMTINCEREEPTPATLKQHGPVDFSTVYFEAGQQILVPKGSPITGPQDLGGKRVCAPKGSTSERNLTVSPVPKNVIIWEVPNQTDCLVMLQQGEVDAISTDNTILQGLAAQDPNTQLVGPTFSQEPYGMAISKAHPDFTAFVNGVLANIRSDGTWASIYAKWLGPFTPGPTPAPPPATYKATP